MRSMKSVLSLVGLCLLVIASASFQEKVLGTPAINPAGNIEVKVTTLQCPKGSRSLLTTLSLSEVSTRTLRVLLAI